MLDLLAVFSDRHHIWGDSVTHQAQTHGWPAKCRREIMTSNEPHFYQILVSHGITRHFHTIAEPILSQTHLSAWNIHFLDEIGDRLLLKFVASVLLHISTLFSVSEISVFMYFTYVNVLSNNKLCWCPYICARWMSLCVCVQVGCLYTLCTHITYIFGRLSLNFVCVMCNSHPLCATFV